MDKLDCDQTSVCNVWEAVARLSGREKFVTPRTPVQVSRLGLPLATRATVELVSYTTVYRGQSSLILTYPTLDSCITYN